MITINLSAGFSPYGKSTVDFEIFNFPSGCEPHIKFGLIVADRVYLTTQIQSMNDLMILFLATDAIRRMGIKLIDVTIPYLPFARQDRVMVLGEPLSIKVIADLINSQNYNSVTVYDPHSDVAPALLNNCVAKTNYKFVDYFLRGKKDYYMISPDAGAYKKLFNLCKAIGFDGEIAVCNKVRNVATGEIISTTISVDDFKGKDCVIVDDICSRGGTFIGIANELQKRNCGKIYLIVSHYEGSADERKLSESGIYKVIKTNSMNDIESNFIHNINLEHGLFS